MIRDPVAEFGALIEEVKFASDSPLEGDGFELSVPHEEKPILRDGLCRFFPTLPFRDGPNPSAFASRNVSAGNSGTLGYLQDVAVADG